MLRYIELFFMFAFVTLITMWIQALQNGNLLFFVLSGFEHSHLLLLATH
ncbi:Undefined function [Listeria monocytogenes N53-1]|nr:Undefined function [Listeria monocytogenes N53-1]